MEHSMTSESNQQQLYQFCGYELKITQDFKHLTVPAMIWDAGIVLCRYFEETRINFTGKKVIELGSGTGLVGILASLLGGEVTLTDRPNVLNQIVYNVNSNIPSELIARTKVSALQWDHPHDQYASKYDIIIGSDIVYDPRQFQPLINMLLHLSNPDTVIYFSSKLIKNIAAVVFYEKKLPMHFDFEIVHTLPHQLINVYKITRRIDSD
ncbi:EEF1A lysine methyltransferase 3-like [Amblyraja radiata]|uniref:EEF1A lysine methyltransferase 3-like n=1 Tax=Amblyraja radiata TaxID=386614 RepID=UPI001403DCF5|nr:EEF1A lysine methyltransferase 3-like [Amblyraja radiata]